MEELGFCLIKLFKKKRREAEKPEGKLVKERMPAYAPVLKAATRRKRDQAEA
ncbi:hypothetical protein JW826_01275 [Candidatus Woesearchaeota archaeon]|nr:hypothetical protein [Candidatus Woesearchaeota archaeon]